MQKPSKYDDAPESVVGKAKEEGEDTCITVSFSSVPGSSLGWENRNFLFLCILAKLDFQSSK